MSGQSIGKIFLDLGVNYDGFNSQLKGIAGKVKGLASTVLPGLGIAVGGAFAVDKLIKFSKASIDVASDLIEVQNVVDVTFGSMAKDVNEFSKTALREFGLSELSAKQYTSTMGAMLKSSGLTGKAVKDMSIEMAKLTADMASFYNLDSDVAFGKIRAGISGETEPLKQLGINMNVANLEAFALSQGIKTAYNEMSQAEQVMLRYNYLLKVSKDSQGDFSRNVGTWANQVKILKEQWQEFMALIGKALIEVLLPVIKFLNKVLELLIRIAKKIGEIYAMITGKEIAVETNESIGDTAIDAADGEDKLAKGIEKAGKAARKALMPFDELNILQKDVGSGKGGGLGNFNTGLNENKVVESIADGIRKTKDDTEEFYAWMENRHKKLGETLAIPVTVPAPIFTDIPDPVYKPNWGLELPPIRKPVFQPIPNPIYEPNWNLVPPLVPVVEIPPINAVEYEFSLDELKIKTSEVFDNILEQIKELKQSSVQLFNEIKIGVSKENEETKANISKTLSAIEGNFNIHKTNVGTISAAIAALWVANLGKGMNTSGLNTNAGLESLQESLNLFGKNVGIIAAAASLAWVKNMNEGLKTTASNLGNFFKSTVPAMKDWAVGLLRISADWARNFVSNIVSGLKTAWDNFKNYAKAAGEKVSGWFSENKKVVTTVAIAGAAVGAGILLAPVLPGAISYAAGALAGLSSMPAFGGAFAKGGVIDQPTLALIGEAGKEAVVPLENNTEWMNKLSRKLIEQMLPFLNISQQSNGNITIVVKIGEDTIMEKVISNINRESRISGETVILT